LGAILGIKNILYRTSSSIALDAKSVKYIFR
jgi:hypothetical protein